MIKLYSLNPKRAIQVSHQKEHDSSRQSKMCIRNMYAQNKSGYTE